MHCQVGPAKVPIMIHEILSLLGSGSWVAGEARRVGAVAEGVSGKVERVRVVQVSVERVRVMVVVGVGGKGEGGGWRAG